ncbi:hypothetical protein [Psychroserpens sp. SPM9]|uniref:hypothetical protein n=1 Tax=Psychroserpens sp. SPM9 TaxID=2975598 RepID=UPI0021A44FDE|nr:hypothetical protein [Psychroserpens sp. SPM9]MDG5489945.1 hypothetical protein [Psychroserpens sp. SPM9]
MKQFIKITLFIVAISALVVFSKQIQNEFIETYNYCVAQLASQTLTSTNPIGF